MVLWTFWALLPVGGMNQVSDSDTKPEAKPEPDAPTITLEELLGAGRAHLKRTLIFEMDDGTEITRTVIFRRLTYKESSDLAQIPREEDAKYTSMVVFLASIQPKFNVIDEVLAVSHGFVQHYSRLILDESGKNPFLLKR